MNVNKKEVPNLTYSLQKHFSLFLFFFFFLGSFPIFKIQKDIPCPWLVSSFVRLVQVIILFLKVRSEKRGALMCVCLVFIFIFLLSSIG